MAEEKAVLSAEDKGQDWPKEPQQQKARLKRISQSRAAQLQVPLVIKVAALNWTTHIWCTIYAIGLHLVPLHASWAFHRPRTSQRSGDSCS